MAATWARGGLQHQPRHPAAVRAARRGRRARAARCQRGGAARCAAGACSAARRRRRPRRHRAIAQANPGGLGCARAGRARRPTLTLRRDGPGRHARPHRGAVRQRFRRPVRSRPGHAAPGLPWPSTVDAAPDGHDPVAVRRVFLAYLARLPRFTHCSKTRRGRGTDRHERGAGWTAHAAPARDSASRAGTSSSRRRASTPAPARTSASRRCFGGLLASAWHGS